MRIEVMQTGPLSVNTYLLWNDASENMAVADPAGETEAILARADALGKKISHILLTHGHFDHILAVNELRAVTHAKVYASEKEVDMLRDPLYNHSAGFSGQPCVVEADVPLRGGDIIEGLGEEIVVMPTPGHSPGSVCYIMDKDMLSGDTLFRQGYGRTDLRGGSMETLMQSLKLLAQLPSDMRVYPGHGPATTIGEEFDA